MSGFALTIGLYSPVPEVIEMAGANFRMQLTHRVRRHTFALPCMSSYTVQDLPFSGCSVVVFVDIRVGFPRLLNMHENTC